MRGYFFMETFQSNNKIVTRTIGLKPVDLDLRNTDLITVPFLYATTLKIDSGFDGIVNRDIKSTKQTIFRLLTENTNDWQSLFEQAFGVGTKVDKWGLRADDLVRIEQFCTSLYTQNLQSLEQESQDGKKYLPKDTVSNFVQAFENPLERARFIYCLGFSAGVLFRNDNRKKEISIQYETDSNETRETQPFINLMRYKQLLTDAMKIKANDFVGTIFIGTDPIPNTLNELERSERLLSNIASKLIPDFENRMFKIIGKKKARTYKVNGKEASEWNLEYYRLIPLAEQILQRSLNTNSLSELDSNSTYMLAARIRRLFLKREVLVRDLISGRFQTQKNVNETIDEFLVSFMDRPDFSENTPDRLYDEFLTFLISNVSGPDKKQENLVKPIIPKELINTSFSSDEKIRILDAISPFDSAYGKELDERTRDEIFYRWMKAFSILADMNKPEAGKQLLRAIADNKFLEIGDFNELKKNVSSFIEFGLPFDELSTEQREMSERMELLDEINHFIRVVTGLKFESLIQKPEDFKLHNVSRQFVRMIYVLINKKIARGQLNQNDLYPVKAKQTYAGINTKLNEVCVFDEHMDGYPYIQTILEIPDLNSMAKRKASILLMNLLLKYPMEIAVPTFLFTIYDAFGDIEVRGVVNQVFENKTSERELKTFFIGDKGAVSANDQFIGYLPNTALRNQLGRITNTKIISSVDGSGPYSSLIKQSMEKVQQAEWDDISLKKRIQPIIEQLKAKIKPDQPVTLDCEFFHIHADETSPTNVQLVSGLVAQVLNRELKKSFPKGKVVGRPVIDNAHVIDRLDYDIVKKQAGRFGVEIPEVVFEGSPLQQWIGDQLFKLIPPPKLVRRGNSLYYKVNQYAEVELYTNIGSENVTQACVLNHIANDVYKLNPQLWNELFQKQIAIFAPDIVQLWKDSGQPSFEQFYYQMINNQNSPEKRDRLKESMFKTLTATFLGYLDSLDAGAIGKSDSESILSQVILANQSDDRRVPVQILENFFGEQGEKYRALFKEIKQQLPALNELNLFRIVYDLNTGNVTLMDLASN